MAVPPEPRTLAILPVMGENAAPVPEVRAQVEALRRKLLDLTLRNRMLNFRPSKRLGIAVVGEDSCQVLRILTEGPEGDVTAIVGPAPVAVEAIPALSAFQQDPGRPSGAF